MKGVQFGLFSFLLKGAHAFNLLSDSGGGKTIALYTIMLSLWLDHRNKFVYYTFILSTIIVIMISMKMLYKGDRPQWIDNELTT